MWDDNTVETPQVINNHYENDYGTSSGGFYVGRGRGFASSLANALPEIGSKSVSAKSSNYEADAWDDGPTDNGGDSWQPQSNSNNYESYQGNKSGGGGGDRSCYNCGDSGHMSRDCPTKSQRGGGGGDRNCYNCGDSGHMSRDCPTKSQRGGSGGDRNCYNCGDSGHMSRDCPTKSQRGGGGGGGDRNCYNCGDSGHMSRDCPTKSQRGGGGGGGGGGDRNCYNCGDSGHMSRDCPTKSQRGGGDSNRNCFNCGDSGHMSRDCPTKSQGGGGGDRTCHKCNETGHIARECPNSEYNSNSRGSACFKCKKEGHMAKDCTEEVLDENGKPRPAPYIPPEPEEDGETLFQQMGVPTGINFSKYDDIHVDVTGTGSKDFPPIDSFEHSKINSHLLQNISRANYTKPTPVQKYAIPIIMNKRDLMACAQTGSGKTAAFLLPMLHEMITSPNLPSNRDNLTQEPWAIIVAPTRELAIQIGSEARKFAYDSIIQIDVVYGGTSVSHQTRRIQRGCHLLVATPGRLLDFVEKGKVSFGQLHYLVLDEADRMLDMGFAPAIQKMVDHRTMPEKGTRQTLMFSATFPEDIQRMAGDFLHNYLFLTVGMVGAANTDVEQRFHNLQQHDKRIKLLEILQSSGTDRTLVFVELKRTADFIATYCSQTSIPTTSIHGDRMQKEREEALRDFRTGRMPVLVATAVAARGLDIRDVRHVINYDLPKTIDEYVHRIGRTGRVGNTGLATSFYDSNVDQPLSRSLKKILIDAQQEIPVWLSEEADKACDMPMQFGGRGNFTSRDIRNQGGRRPNPSNDAFDNYPTQSQNFSEPAEEEEVWG